MEALVLALGFSPEKLITILTVALGLGLVIFFHELGHFAVAKWCNVLVERFSIGFGPILLRKQWGETEYALSAIPFGGYVKMLGQDDVDPAQMTDAEKAEDPRSYTAKNVWQRMAIISAGVIMNIITGTMFFAIVYAKGYETLPSRVGYVQVGSPAWVNGVREWDRIFSINGVKTEVFEDISKETLLSSGPLTFVGLHADDTRYEFTANPSWNEFNRQMGMGPAIGVQLLPEGPSEGKRIAIANPGTPAAKAGFQPGDKFVEINGQAIESARDLDLQLRKDRSETLEVVVERQQKEDSSKTERTKLSVAPMNFRTLGIRFDIGKVSALRNDSPAAKGGIQVNDRLSKVDGREIGSDLDPFRLPDYFSDHAGREVVLTVSRELKGGPPESVEIRVVPDSTAPWSEPPHGEKEPLSIPSLGLAIQVIPKILSVDPEGPAAKAGIKENQSLEEISFLPIEDEKFTDILGPQAKVFTKLNEQMMARVFWVMQEEASARKVELTVKTGEGKSEKFTLTPAPEPDWYLPTLRGLSRSDVFRSETFILKATSPGDAITRGARETRKRIMEVFRTLAALVRGDLSPFKLSGPVGIAKIGYAVAQENLIQFVMFLGLISINLAVINFLPIPLLDGGHMLFLLYEGVTGQKPNERIVIWATYLGLMFIVGLMVFVLGIDLFMAKK